MSEVRENTEHNGYTAETLNYIQKGPKMTVA
jgi:hypothetical protein